jgi:FtsZ-interacting cell division protein ZipA
LSTLQLGLIVAGVVLVIGVIVYNQWQERRLKRQAASAASADARAARTPERVEPTLGAATAPPTASDGIAAFRGDADFESAFEPPLDAMAPPAEFVDDRASADEGVPVAVTAPTAHSTLATMRAQPGSRSAAMPDHEIECLIPLQPAAPVPASAIAAGLGARIGKALRWFGRADARSDWQRLTADTPGRFGEIVACLLLADRNGAASRAQIDTFVRVVGDLAPTLPAAFAPPDIADEVARAESLDRLCAELDVQIGLTVQKPEPGSIAGTRLRGVAEAAGFRLAPGGRFELAHEETGAVLYTLQNLRPDPFTAESLRLTATNGVVFLLDVARTADPLRTFDQMKLAAKRMAVTLGGELVDDNHRPLDDAAFAVIREQVDGAADALRAVHIEPGSARALALFSA